MNRKMLIGSILLWIILSIGLLSCATQGEAVLADGSSSISSNNSVVHSTDKDTDKTDTETPGEGSDSSDLPVAPATTDDDIKNSIYEDTASETEITDFSGAEEISERDTGDPSSSDSRVSPSTTNRPSASGLRAGFADDNKQFNYFVNFLEKYRKVPHFPLKIDERIRFQVEDAEGDSIANADITIAVGNKVIVSGKTMADGSFLFFPGEYSRNYQIYDVSADIGSDILKTAISRDGQRVVTIKSGSIRQVPQTVPLDIVFIMDTTGSMGEEIQRLKTTIELIHLNLTSLSSRPEVRFGMVLYKDVGDEYNTKVIPLTKDLDDFQTALNKVEASGGGDYPENLQAALDDTINTMDWNTEGIRLGFMITDAPPHLDYDDGLSYADSAKQGKERGIKLFSVGTGGLDITGEYVLRQIAQYTSAKYIFLTYGETGESEGGSAGTVSHHTGANFQTDKLEAIIIRFAKEELSYLTDQPLEDGDEFFQAVDIDGTEARETLKTLFLRALSQLSDYSSIKLTKDTKGGILPILGSTDDLALDAEYFTEQLIFTAAESDAFTMVERKDLQKILEEMELQLSGLIDDSDAVEVGKILEAEVLLVGNLYKKEKNYELFLKMLRVETGEILAVTKAKIELALGLSG